MNADVVIVRRWRGVLVGMVVSARVSELIDLIEFAELLFRVAPLNIEVMVVSQGSYRLSQNLVYILYYNTPVSFRLCTVLGYQHHVVFRRLNYDAVHFALDTLVRHFRRRVRARS